MSQDKTTVDTPLLEALIAPGTATLAQVALPYMVKVSSPQTRLLTLIITVGGLLQALVTGMLFSQGSSRLRSAACMPALCSPLMALLACRWEVGISLLGSCTIAGTYIATFLWAHPPSEVPCWETRTGQEFYTLFVLDAVFRSMSPVCCS